MTYYERKTGIAKAFHKIPYIVESRRSDELLKNLIENPYPILFEGLHTTAFLDHPSLKDRIKIVRTHNIEHDYYNGLADAEKKIIARKYYRSEAAKLKEYEAVLENADHILAISVNDYKYFKERFSSVHYMPGFHPNSEVTIQPGKGTYILYHGNLSVVENIKACLYLIDEVFSKIDFTVKIAGKNPDVKIQKAVQKHRNIQLVSNPQGSEMDEMIHEAQIIVLTTFQNTGLKLKLLATLYNGRHCIVNSKMVENTGLEDLCIIGNTSEELIQLINKVSREEFVQKFIDHRKAILTSCFSNEITVNQILKLI